MTAGERLKNWIESLSKAWGDRLSGWMMSWASKGIVKSLESMEPGAIDAYSASLTKFKDDPNTPPELKQFLEKALATGNPISVVAASLIMVVQAFGVILGGSEPLANLVKYSQELTLKTARLDPLSAITAWRRDPIKYAYIWQDLKELGWDESRIEALKFITQIIPNAADIVRFALREVYTPEIAEQYGQFQDIPEGAYPDAERAGLSKDMFNKYWAAHWGLPSASDGFELLHRGILTEDQLKGLLKANDIMPYWRDQLIKLSWNVPTRVDVRRFWDMRTIDEVRLREVYTALGYHDKDLEDYVLWTKIFVDFPDLLARYKNGWITIDDVKRELIAMGMKPERADTLIEEKIKKAAPERVAAEKDLTRTDIFKGVKQGRITREQGYELLMDLGYDSDEATYLLDINVPADQVDAVVEERQLTKADILTGLKTAVITREEATTKLLELRYSSANVDLLLKIFDAQVSPPEEAKLKEASKADIVSGVKKGLITQEEGYMMLLDIGFDPEAALFILSVATEESPFSPINYKEFKNLTQKYRKASGLEGPPMSDDIKKAAAEVIRLTTERDSLQQSIEREKRGLLTEGGVPVEATARLTQLQASLRQAEAELARVKTEYNRLVIEFKHAIT